MKKTLLAATILSTCLAAPAYAENTLPVPAVSAHDHMLGRASAPVSVIVYSDFECPFCKLFSATTKAALVKYRANVNLVFRHFPLPFHSFAMPAARASECVAKLRGERSFWLYSQLVFAHDTSRYLSAARATGIDTATLSRCMADASIENIVLDEQKAAMKSVLGTPTTFIINHSTGFMQTLEGAVPLETISSAIDDAIKGKPSEPENPVVPPTDSGQPEAAAPVPPVDPHTDHIRGNASARFSVVEYADFECPFCKRHQATMHALLTKYPDSVNWVYRHFPLSFHENAEREAEASECVATLGGNEAFWKFEDAIYDRTESNGTGFSLDALAPLAASVGIDAQAYASCMSNPATASTVETETSSGRNAGINGTPTSILVDHVKGTSTIIAGGALPLSTFTDAIDALLKQ